MLIDLSRCPKCGGPSDNGHDREVPPNPYYCTKCMAEPVQEPWEHLKQYGYAPGSYMSRCHACDKIASGVDKRAITCRPCAEVRHAESQKAEPVQDTAFDRWWDNALDGPTPVAPVSKETARWIWNAARAEPVQEPDDEVCDGSRGGRCIHQDPNQCKPERDCPAFSAPPPAEPVQEFATTNIGCLGMPVNTPVTPPQTAEPVQEPPMWKLVPTEPTIGMCIAGDEARQNVDDLTRTPAIYRAMIAAAPAAPQQAEPVQEPVAQAMQDAVVYGMGIFHGGKRIDPDSIYKKAEPVQEPWEHLKPFGYAPGNYMSKCHICDKIASGVDKRAITCRPCAEARHATLAEPAFHGFMSADGTRVDLCFTPGAPRADGVYATAYYTAPPQRPAEPVAYSVGRTLHWHEGKGVNDAQLFATPPQRKPLTDDAMQKVFTDSFGLCPEPGGFLFRVGRAVEAAHKIGGEG